MLNNIDLTQAEGYKAVEFDVMLSNISKFKIEYTTTAVGGSQPLESLKGSPLYPGESLPAYVLNGAKCWVRLRLTDKVTLSASDTL